MPLVSDARRRVELLPTPALEFLAERLTEYLRSQEEGLAAIRGSVVDAEIRLTAFDEGSVAETENQGCYRKAREGVSLPSEVLTFCEADAEENARTRELLAIARRAVALRGRDDPDALREIIANDRRRADLVESYDKQHRELRVIVWAELENRRNGTHPTNQRLIRSRGTDTQEGNKMRLPKSRKMLQHLLELVTDYLTTWDKLMAEKMADVEDRELWVRCDAKGVPLETTHRVVWQKLKVDIPPVPPELWDYIPEVNSEKANALVARVKKLDEQCIEFIGRTDREAISAVAKLEREKLLAADAWHDLLRIFRAYAWESLEGGQQESTDAIQREQSGSPTANRKRTSAEEADKIASKVLAAAPREKRWKVTELANLVGCHAETLKKTNAWTQAPKVEPNPPKPKAVSLTDKLQSTLGEDDAELARLIEEQAADEQADGYPRRASV